MSVITLLLFFVLAIVNWSAAAQEQKDVEYVAKPATLAALVLFAATGSDPSLWLIGALVCGLLGDVYLMLPGNFFVAGLAAFLLGHFFYIADFDAGFVWRVIWFVVLGAVSMPITSKILAAIKDESLKPGVMVYTAVLTFMAASAIASGSFCAAVGALLFLGSDTILAWNRFVEPIPKAHFYVMVTYHLGQFGLALALRGG